MEYSTSFDRRTMLRLLGVGGLGLALDCAIPSSYTKPGVSSALDASPKEPHNDDPFVLLGTPSESETKPENEPPYRRHTFMPSTFAEYRHATASIPFDVPSITLEDRLLEAYVQLPYKTDELKVHMAGCPDKEPHFRQGAMLPVRDHGRFQELVFAAAQELGYSQQQISAMPIADVVLLSGRIVAHRLDYADEMIPIENGEKIPVAEALTRILQGERFRNEAADTIDSLSADDLLSGGKGVCRNYAKANVAVFNVLRQSNPRLNNTYMRAYSTQQFDHVIKLPHAWNMVSTFVDNGDEFVIRSTYVDPTWLDTRVRNATNEEEPSNQDSLSDEEVYNAFDAKHFGFVLPTDSYDFSRYGEPEQDNTLQDSNGGDLRSFVYEMMSTASMYEVLADKSRTENRNSRFYIPTSLSDYYRARAFDFRIASAGAMLETVDTLASMVENEGSDGDHTSLQAFADLSFNGRYRDLQLCIVRAAENMTGISSSRLMYTDQTIHVPQQQLPQFQHVALRVIGYLSRAAEETFDFDDDGDLNMLPETICGEHIGDPYATMASLSDLFDAVQKNVVASEQ